MFSECKIFILTAVLSAALAVSCSSVRRYSGDSGIYGQLALTLPEDESRETDEEEPLPVVDSSEIHEGPVIMKAVRDSRTGEMTATDVIKASKVVARFRNVAERGGKISLVFDITVPEDLISSDFQLRFSPVLDAHQTRSVLEPVFITGERYRKRQLRGYERYRNFVESIVTDSLFFIRMDQLEKFLERYFPETYAMKNDSTVVSEPEAENLFGVNQASALVHYTRHARKRRNAMKESMKDEMFRRFVKDPFRSGVRLDTVMTDGKGSLVYRYSHLMQSFPGLRKIDVSLFGTVFRDGEQVAGMPSPEKLTFYVSSLSSLADNTPRYMFKVVDRIVRDNTAAFLDFSQGSAGLDTLREGNSSELARIRGCFRDVCSREGLVIDSIVVTASCSPEGRWEYNTKLAEARAETVRSYVRDNISGVDDSLLRSRYIPENWEYLKRIVAGDTLISSESKRLVAEIAGMQDKDRAEEELSRLPEFIHIRTRIYPMLRIVDFSFFMHRPDVKKDTVHTMEIDTVYMNGLLALKNLDYKKAASVLSPYKDYNTALALASSGYDDKALEILCEIDSHDARSYYLEALLLSRMGETEAAETVFRECVRKDPSMRHRANLDPEMASFVRQEPDE